MGASWAELWVTTPESRGPRGSFDNVSKKARLRLAEKRDEESEGPAEEVGDEDLGEETGSESQANEGDDQEGEEALAIQEAWPREELQVEAVKRVAEWGLEGREAAVAAARLAECEAEKERMAQQLREWAEAAWGVKEVAEERLRRLREVERLIGSFEEGASDAGSEPHRLERLLRRMANRANEAEANRARAAEEAERARSESSRRNEEAQELLSRKEREAHTYAKQAREEAEERCRLRKSLTDCEVELHRLRSSLPDPSHRGDKSVQAGDGLGETCQEALNRAASILGCDSRDHVIPAIRSLAQRSAATSAPRPPRRDAGAQCFVASEKPSTPERKNAGSDVDSPHSPAESLPDEHGCPSEGNESESEFGTASCASVERITAAAWGKLLAQRNASCG